MPYFALPPHWKGNFTVIINANTEETIRYKAVLICHRSEANSNTAGYLDTAMYKGTNKVRLRTKIQSVEKADTTQPQIKLMND